MDDDSPTPAEPFRDDDTETALLGAAVSDPGLVPHLLPRVTEHDFASPHHATVWRVIAALSATKRPVSLPAIANELRVEKSYGTVRSGLNFDALPLMAATTEQAEDFARIVGTNGRARRTARAVSRALLRAAQGIHPEDFVSGLLSEVTRAAQSRSSLQSKTFEEIGFKTFERLEREARTTGIGGLTSGLSQLDKRTGGTRPGQLVVIAGRPGMGKSALAMHVGVASAVKSMATADARNERAARTLVFSAEMEDEELFEREMCNDASLDSMIIRRGELKQHHWEAMVTSTNKLASYPIDTFDAPGMTPESIRSAALQKRSEGPIAMVVIDHLGHLELRQRGETRSDASVVGDAARRFKGMAKELGCPVVLLCQLNRKCEERPDKRPILSDLKDSGDIEAAADAVWFVYRDEYYSHGDTKFPGLAEIIIAKQRGGRTGRVFVSFTREFTRFGETTQEQDDLIAAAVGSKQPGGATKSRRGQTAYGVRTQPRQEHDNAAE